jgi:arylformamidase
MTQKPRRKPAPKASKTPKTKRKLVYLHYTKEELDAQYNQRVFNTDLAPYQALWTSETERARRTLPCHLDVPYGRKPIEKLDIYLPAKKLRKPAPVLFFIRGGAWRLMSKNIAASAAPAYAAEGAIFVTPDFGLAPDTPLAEMVRQVRRALTWTWKNIAKFGGDPNRLIVAGHSSGAHLSSMLLADGWRKQAGLPEDAIKGGVLFSGAYDLAPVRLSARNDYLFLTPSAARRLSPLGAIPRRGPPLFVGIASGDLHEFQRQGRALAEAWRKARNPVEFAEIEGANHFDMADLFADPTSILGRTTRQMLKKSAG